MPYPRQAETKDVNLGRRKVFKQNGRINKRHTKDRDRARRRTSSAQSLYIS